MDMQIMNKDIVAAEFSDGELHIIDKQYLPLYLQFRPDVFSWLETRAIDAHRANSRLLKKALRLAERDDISAVLHVNAATITDNYWIRPKGSILTYNEVKFDNDYFSNLALNGGYDSYNRAASGKHSKTPELTNIGSFEKCWKLKNGKWVMFKRANHNELFSELFVYELGKAFGFNMAEYRKGKGYIISEDFTCSSKYNFEPAFSFMGDNDNYEDVIKKLDQIYPNALGDYIKMIFLDTITANPDRHTANFGLLTDSEDNRIIGLAPNFDNNMALISRGYPKVSPEKDVLISEFIKLINAHSNFKEFIPELSPDIIINILEKINMRVRRQYIVDFVMKRYEYIKKISP